MNVFSKRGKKMIYILRGLVFIALFSVVKCKNQFINTLLNSQDKICAISYDEKEGSYETIFQQLTHSQKKTPEFLKTIDPNFNQNYFTGFKFQKLYKMTLKDFQFDKYFRITYCYNGKKKFVEDRPLSTDMDWETPYCFFIPDDSNKNNSIKFLNEKLSDYNQMFRQTRNEDLTSKSGAGSDSVDLSNYHCFKLARRKKYSTRKYSLFMPGNWIGGFFYCNLAQEHKQKLYDIFENRSSNNTEEEKMFINSICSIENTIPLLPLNADDFSKSWYEINPKLKSKENDLNLEIRKFVPYINTPNFPLPLVKLLSDKDFQSQELANNHLLLYSSISQLEQQNPYRQLINYLNKTTELLKSQHSPSNISPKNNTELNRIYWYNDIKVREDYSNMTLMDISKTDHFVDLTYRLLNFTLSQINKKKNISKNKILKRFQSNDIMQHIETDIEFETNDNTSFEDYYLALYSKYKKHHKLIRDLWENITLSYESFNYRELL